MKPCVNFYSTKHPRPLLLTSCFLSLGLPLVKVDPKCGTATGSARISVHDVGCYKWCNYSRFIYFYCLLIEAFK